MEHIVQFGIGIDDNAIVKRVENEAVSEITKDIKQATLDQLFQKDYYSRHATLNGKFSEFGKQIVQSFFNENKDKIIERTAELLARKLSCTKAVKEQFGKDGSE